MLVPLDQERSNVAFYTHVGEERIITGQIYLIPKGPGPSAVQFLGA